MKIIQSIALSTLLIGLPCACSSTESSVTTNIQPEEMGEVATTLCEEGVQVEFLRGLEGTFDVIYQVYNQANAEATSFEGHVTYEWDHKANVLVGSHDSWWGDVPFQSAILMAFDMQDETYCMGWAKSDGDVVLPMLPMVESGVPGEMVVQRNTSESVSRTVMTMQNSNTHTVRRFVQNENGVESLVLEMICTRMPQ